MSLGGGNPILGNGVEKMGQTFANDHFPKCDVIGEWGGDSRIPTSGVVYKVEEKT